MVAIAAADEEPSGIGNHAGCKTGGEGGGEADLMFSGQTTGGEEHRCCGKGDPELLDQNPSEEQQIAVSEKNVFG